MAVTVPQGTSGTVVNTTNWNVLVDRINASIDKDGTIALTANWDVGAFTITCTQLTSDIAGGTPPLVVTSTTVVPNLNVDQVDGFDLDQALLIASSPQFVGLTLTGSLTAKLTTITNADTPYTIGATVNLICDTSSGLITVNLPASSGISGRTYRIKNSGSSGNNVTLDGNASETIDGSTTLTLIDAEAATIVNDGSNWHIM